MKSNTRFTSPFGNAITESSARSARRLYRLCHFLFDKDDTPVSTAAVPSGEAYNDFGMLTVVDRSKSTVPVQEIDPHKAVLIGTIRMGFGHWRMAIAIASAAHHMGYTPYLLDLISFDGSTAQKSIHFLEHWYDFFSQLSQKSKWFNEHIWEKATSVSNRRISSSVTQRYLAQLFVPLFQTLPKDIPVLSMHPWIGQAAVLSGMTNVVSIIPDNLPMGFWLVEGSRHTVQSPSAYMGYRTLLSMDTKRVISRCIPEGSIIEAGHYVDYEITSSIEYDCERRIRRMHNKEPRRFLLTMGGAGAQARRFADIIHTCEPFILQNRASFFINMGDHKGRWEELKTDFDRSHIAYTMHSDWSETKKFISESANGQVQGIHVFLHDNFYAAVYVTNLLMHISDIMITKPSELSFYPIPKLFIQRVGRHEAWGAIRGSEMGDGTIETDSTVDLHRTLFTLIESDDLLKLYIRHIRLNDSTGVYDGAYNVIKYAVGETVLTTQ